MGEVFKVEYDVQRARQDAHSAVDAFWKEGHCSRGATYAWIRRVLVVPPPQAHIASMNIERCLKLIEFAEAKGPGTPFWASWYRKTKTRRGGRRGRRG